MYSITDGKGLSFRPSLPNFGSPSSALLVDRKKTRVREPSQAKEPRLSPAKDDSPRLPGALTRGYRQCGPAATELPEGQGEASACTGFVFPAFAGSRASMLRATEHVGCEADLPAVRRMWAALLSHFASARPDLSRDMLIHVLHACHEGSTRA